MSLFITFEGTEGSGKSTQIELLSGSLRSLGYEVVVTREPGGDKVGDAIRDILLHGDHIDSVTELMLFLADRAHHVRTLIRPALARGSVVLCDRYADSTNVYQGYARGLDVDYLRDLNAFVTGGLQPELTLLLDLPVELGLRRVPHADRLDCEGVNFHQRVREGFLKEAARDSARYRIISADRGIEETRQAVWAAVNPLLPKERS